MGRPVQLMALALLLGPNLAAAIARDVDQDGMDAVGQARDDNEQVQDPCSEPYPQIPFGWRPSRKVLALTFDDGPELRGLTAVLDVLRARHVRATFFVNSYASGDWLGPFTAPATQAVLRRLLAEGHELGSHAAEHLRLSQLSPAEIDRQLDWAVGNITAVTNGSSVPLFRAPYGDGFLAETAADEATAHLWDAVRRRHVHIGWSFAGGDHKLGDVPNCSDQLFGAYGPPLVANATAGAVLMHSTSPNAMGGCPEGLARIIEHWQAAGYKFVLASELVQERYGEPPAAVVRRAQSCG